MHTRKFLPLWTHNFNRNMYSIRPTVNTKFLYIPFHFIPLFPFHSLTKELRKKIKFNLFIRNQNTFIESRLPQSFSFNERKLLYHELKIIKSVISSLILAVHFRTLDKLTPCLLWVYYYGNLSSARSRYNHIFVR